MGLIRHACGGCLLALSLASLAVAAADPIPGTPRVLSAAEQQAYPAPIATDGRNLPPGSGTVAAGERLFAARCVACHGVEGRGGPGGELAGGEPDLTRPSPDRTIGTYWPYATTLFDFIRRAMPLGAPWSLTDAEVYALCAYLLDLNGIAVPDERLDATTLPRIRMPNRGGFVGIDADFPAPAP